MLTDRTRFALSMTVFVSGLLLAQSGVLLLIWSTYSWHVCAGAFALGVAMMGAALALRPGRAS
jgi:hypothetical protein